MRNILFCTLAFLVFLSCLVYSLIIFIHHWFTYAAMQWTITVWQPAHVSQQKLTQRAEMLTIYINLRNLSLSTLISAGQYRYMWSYPILFWKILWSFLSSFANGHFRNLIFCIYFYPSIKKSYFRIVYL